MRFLIFIFKHILHIKFRFLLRRSIVIVDKGGVCSIGKNVIIKNSFIHVRSNAELKINKNTQIIKSIIHAGYCIYKTNPNNNAESHKKCKLHIGENNIINMCYIEQYGECVIDNNNIFESTLRDSKLQIMMSGKTKIGSYNRIRATIWTRYNATLTIGNRNAINQRTEIRADEFITIGNYNMISYDCVIWDTNTHNIYPFEERRCLTDKTYPKFGCNEPERPATNPVKIGNDCWIGRYSAILKGCVISDKCIVAFHTTISGGEFESNTTIMNTNSIRTKRNNI